MNRTIEEMLEPYVIENIYDKKNAIKEIMQEIVLCGLSKAGFFKEAAFYGGTALRIFYGLDRFSEDLDFSLEVPNKDFALSKYFDLLEKEINSYGLNVKIENKEKTHKSDVQSAFVKGNTMEYLLKFYSGESFNVSKNEVIKVKFEVDTNPPAYATFEHKYRLLPRPYEVKMYDLPSLFAGKIHAVICRAWKNRVKGRDLYDYCFYISKKVKFNRKYLREKLIQSGYIDNNSTCSLDDVKSFLYQKFESIDFKQAKKDVEPFIKDITVLDVWSCDFFKEITNDLLDY